MGSLPLVFTDQLVRNRQFRGGRVTDDWPAEQVSLITGALDRIARWLRDLDYVDAPAGIDGFLLRGEDGPRFVALDPNIRMTGTMMPWAVVAALSDASARRFVWQVEAFRVIGLTLTLERLHRRLGADLLDRACIEQSGILPSIILSTGRVGGVGVTLLVAILLAPDLAHLDHLLNRILHLGALVA
jgi:hypothetical protein